MSYRYIFHAGVKTDYDEAYDWYELEQEGLGEKFLLAFRLKIKQIAEQPDTYGEKSKKGYREAKMDNFPFSIIYTIYKRKKIIFVSSLHHQSKDPKKKYRKPHS
jgi:mRNA-degrading endonuclease RelE of RelBE toxin-antitoxin system